MRRKDREVMDITGIEEILRCCKHNLICIWRLKMSDYKITTEIVIRPSIPGDAGYVAYMHGKFYFENHGFYPSAEYYFIKHLADFVHDPTGGRLWIAGINSITVGSIAIVRVDVKTAQLRWFLVDEGYQGIGIGNRLIQTAIGFCRDNKYDNVFLWTFKGLDKARTLYDKYGFILTEEKANNEWSNAEIIEQKLELKLP
jgi:GNAT superfamily N-acetyltransferase